jgi:hypothetical protein
MSKTEMPIPDGVTEITEEHQLDLVHFELRSLKPKGSILFPNEAKEISFQFFAGDHRADGIIAKLSGSMTPAARRVFEHCERFSRVESYVTVVLLQFKMMFLTERVSVVYQSGQVHLKFAFPSKILKTHRRKFIRIPFNEKFPAELRFKIDDTIAVRKLKDLSREGMRIILEPGDSRIINPEFKMKHAVLKVLNREMPVGLNVVAVHGEATAGIKIVAISEVDKLWIKDCIRILMGQILGLDNKKFDDQLEPDDPTNKGS